MWNHDCVFGTLAFFLHGSRLWCGTLMCVDEPEIGDVDEGVVE